MKIEEKEQLKKEFREYYSGPKFDEISCDIASNWWFTRIEDQKKQWKKELIKSIEEQMSNFTGNGSEYNQGRCDGYYERENEIIKIIQPL